MIFALNNPSISKKTSGRLKRKPPGNTKRAWLRSCKLISQSAFSTGSIAAELSDIEKCVKWERKEHGLEFHKRTGRSALHYSYADNERIKAFKIKGAGALTHTGKIIPPTNIPLHNDNPHLGFTASGEFVPIKSDPAPIGAITLERAEQESRISQILVEHNCPSIVPLQVYQYTDANMRFINKGGVSVPLGVVVSGVPSRSHLRGDSIFKFDELDADDNDTLRDWISSIKEQKFKHFTFSEEHPHLSLISALSRLYGKTIRKFSEAGLYRYSGAPDNYSYSIENKEVFLIDLDSSMELDAVSPIRQSLEIMRDAASGLAYLLAFFSNPVTRHNFPTEDVIRENPFRQLLIGYYADVYEEDPAYIDALSQVIVRYYERVCNVEFPIRKGDSSQDIISSSPEETLEDEEQEARKFETFLSRSYLRPWISRSETFSYLMPICWLLHSRSRSMMALAPKILRRQKLFKSIEDYNCICYGGDKSRAREVVKLIETEIQIALGAYI